MHDDKRIFSLLEITQSLRSVIERSYTSTYWIKAEIARLNFYPRSGHCYPELVEKSANIIKAQMRATIWASDYQNISNNFQAIVGEPLKEGISILFRAAVTFHPVYGLSLNIFEIEPAFTLGEMALEKQKTIERLIQEELFEKNKTTQLPMLPSNIAVISVETSKGYHDFLNIINNHPRQFALSHTLFPAILQGDRAVETISAQMRIIRKKAAGFDAVAIIRGGGGDIGLNCYDSYQMAKEIALCPIPVVTGIGHSTNETIVEMIAWENKITPTDVAYFFLSKFESFFNRIQENRKALLNNAEKLLKQESFRIKNSISMIKAYSGKSIQNQSNQLINHAKHLHNISANQVTYHNNKLANTIEKLSYYPKKHIFKYQTELSTFDKLFPSVSKQKIRAEGTKISLLENTANLLDPKKTLQRGYSITLHKGKQIKSSESIKKEDEIETVLSKGKIISIVKKQKS